MHSDSRNLLSAVSMSAGRELDPSDFEDGLVFQKGCYILNCWGYGPEYHYSLYIRGPYSHDLADDIEELGGGIGADTDVSDADLDRLRGILDRDPDYAVAYTTVLLVKNYSPRATNERIRGRAIEIKPYLEAEIDECCASLLT